ncbi:MAG: hypothetical protein ACKVS8_02115 [Phycisphaerales bacterium]
MNKGILLVILAAAGIGGYLAYQSSVQKKSASAGAAATKGPGPGDPVLSEEETPASVMVSVARLRRQADQDAQAAQWVGHWLPESGWMGPVEAITNTSGGKSFRIPFTTTGLLTNAMWVVAEVPEGWQYSNGFEAETRNFITFGGRIDKVEVIPASTYKPVPDYRIVVKDAYVMSISGR